MTEHRELPRPPKVAGQILDAGLALTRLAPHEATLEEAFMSVTRSSLDYVATINGQEVA